MDARAVTTGRTAGAPARRAASRLVERLPDLADRLTAEILSGDGALRPAGLTDDLWDACHTGLRHGIEAILDPGRRPDLHWARELGRRRAEQGLPLDQLLRSYRLAGRVFWESLVEVAAQHDPDQLPALAHHAVRVWQTIDQQSSVAAEAYRRTEFELLRRDEEQVQAVVDALLEGRGADGRLLAAATTVLGLPARGRFAVAVLRQDDALSRPVTGRPETAGGIRFLWRLRADARIAVADLGDADLDDLAEVLRAHACHHVGLSPVVDSPADLGHARWLAELALRTCRSPRQEVARLDRRLPAALVVSQPELAEHLRRSVLDGLTALDPAKRGLLLKTLDAWLECGGSATAAARRLYCHPNTVLNRLRHLERISGRSVSRPLDLVEIVLARHALQKDGGNPA